MARITALPAAGPLIGTELIPVDDGTTTRKTTTGALAALVAEDNGFAAVITAAGDVATAVAGINSVTDSLNMAGASNGSPAAPLSQASGGYAGGVGGALTGIWINTNPNELAAITGYARRCAIRHNTALVGRTAKVQIWRPDGGGWRKIWSSAAIACAGIGVTYATLPREPLSIVQPGDALGLWSSAPTNADGIGYTSVTGDSVVVNHTLGIADPAIGTIVTAGAGGYSSQSTRNPQFFVEIESLDRFVTRDEAGQRRGYAGLNDSGVAPVAVLPHFGGRALAAIDTVPVIENGKRVFRPVPQQWTDAYPSLGGGTATFASGITDVYFWWNGAAPGASKAGYLNAIEIAAGCNIPANCKLQLWICQPITTPPAAITGAFNLHPARHIIGEFDLASLGAGVTTQPIRIEGLDLYVGAGDLVGISSPQGFGIVFSSAAPFHADCFMGRVSRANLKDGADTTVSLMSEGGRVVVDGATRRLLVNLEFSDGPEFSLRSGPGAIVRTDTSGNLAASVARAADLPFKGKKVLVLGNSIDTPAGGGNGADTGHIVHFSNFAQCTVTNRAFGGGYDLWPTAHIASTVDDQFYGGTEAELVARAAAVPGFSTGDPGQFSFERRILSDTFDLLILGNMVNTNNASGSFSIGAKGSTDPSTIWGGLGRIVAFARLNRPEMAICIQGLPHRWANYTTPGSDPVEQANREQWNDALRAFAAYHSCFFADYLAEGGIDFGRVKNGTGLFDGIHPLGVRKPQMGRVLFKATHP